MALCIHPSQLKNLTISLFYKLNRGGRILGVVELLCSDGGVVDDPPVYCLQVSDLQEVLTHPDLFKNLGFSSTNDIQLVQITLEAHKCNTASEAVLHLVDFETKVKMPKEIGRVKITG